MELCIITGNSMSPTMPEGTIFFTVRPSPRKLKRGRVIIFGYGGKDDMPMAKRIIGCPGDVVELRGRSVFVNGRWLMEPYIIPPNEDYDPEQITLCAGEYYVLGDNRPNSVDSRLFGPIQQREINGVMLFAIRLKGENHELTR